ncbi:3-dehydroquinate synthase [Rhodobacteraceae bacterium NNCM2]|nr:3-dehydroquinate synthase [Coraliihabitans acroporae]
MKTVLNVGLGARSYDIVIGPDLLAGAGELVLPFLPRPRTVIVTDETVAGLHLDTLTDGLAAAGIEAEAIILPAGEATKSMANLALTVERLLELKVERDDLIIAFGGGVIGDLAGFAAAILRRGVDFIQIPTTLLAQVDSAVGGKTGVNSPHGKNLIGAFHQPKLVLADIAVLETLSGREFLAGYGEVMKYGLLGDAEFFAWLEANAPAMRDGDREARMHAVRRACEMKAEIVARDEKERGDRALLNLGHTFGHALEAATGYSYRLLHGEGVAIGCGLAFDVSARMGLCAQEAPSRIHAHMAEMGMKRRLSDIEGELPDAKGLIALMSQDKKVRQGQLAFILARGIGESFITREADMTIVEDVLSEALAEA